MSDLDEVTRLPQDFDGCVRLFPLPELVLFPHAMQPLQIFEPRYCDMLMESLASDKLIAMATLTSGVSDLLSWRPTIATTVCIGKVVSHAETEDGRHNILLIGAKRAKVIREMETNRSFRMAEVEVQVDIHHPLEAEKRQALRASLLDAFAAVIPSTATVQQNLHELMAGQMGLGPITDIIAFTIPLRCEEKLRLLEEVDVDQRAQMLIEMLQRLPSPEPLTLAEGLQKLVQAADKRSNPPSFPPPFSIN